MYLKLLFLSSLLCFFLTGCAVPELRHDTTSIDDVTTMSKDATTRSTYFSKRGNDTIICLEPNTDSAQTSSSGISLGISGVGGGGNIGEKSGEGAMSFGGMDPEVLLTSILLYRACELTTNINADPEKTVEIYDRFLKTIELLGKFQINDGSKAISAVEPLPSFINEDKNLQQDHHDKHGSDEAGVGKGVPGSADNDIEFNGKKLPEAKEVSGDA